MSPYQIENLEATGDKAFGLRFVGFLQPTSYHALGVALLYSAPARRVNTDAWMSYIVELLRQVCSLDFSPQCVALTASASPRRSENVSARERGGDPSFIRVGMCPYENLSLSKHIRQIVFNGIPNDT